MSQAGPAQRPQGGPMGGGPGRGPMGGGPMGMMGMPVQKAKNFRQTFFRLLGYFKPQALRLIIVFVAAIIGSVFNIVGPKVLALATDKLAYGYILKLGHVPGAAIDFGYIGNILLILIGLYLVSALFTYIQQYVMPGLAAAPAAPHPPPKHVQLGALAPH